MTRTTAILFFCLVAPFLPAQPLAGPAVPQGAYRFVHFTWSDGERMAAASQGGTLTFDPAGVARWGDTAARYQITGPFEAKLIAGETTLALRTNEDAGIIVGSAASTPGARHHILVAVRAAEGLAPATVNGNYGVATLAAGHGVAAGLATAFGQFTADGAGHFPQAVLNGHAAGVDDVNRREERKDLTYEAASDGTGIAHLGEGSDLLNGDVRLAMSADGALILGWSADPAHPAILLALRKLGEVATFSFQGRFSMAEMIAENSFAFQQSTRLSSAWGTLDSNRIGVAYISQRVLSGGETTYLATTNRYRVSSDGASALSPKLDTALNNLTFNQTAFVGAHVGLAGQLSLTHGIFFGVAKPASLPTLVNEASPLIPDAPVVPGAAMAFTGTFAAVSGVRVNGVEAALGAVTPERVSFRVPAAFEGDEALVEIMAAGKVEQSHRGFRAASAPAIFTAEGSGIGVASAQHEDGSPVLPFKAAEPGEAISFEVTGLGPAPTLRVLFDGQPGEVSSAAPIADKPSHQRVQVIVPRDVKVAAGATVEVPIAVATPDAFVDLADVMITRRAAAQQ